MALYQISQLPFSKFLTAASSMYAFYLVKLHSHLLGSSPIQGSHPPGGEQNKCWFPKRPPSCKISSVPSWRKQKNKKFRMYNYVYRERKPTIFFFLQTGLFRIKRTPLSEAWSGSRQLWSKGVGHTSFPPSAYLFVFVSKMLHYYMSSTDNVPWRYKIS